MKAFYKKNKTYKGVTERKLAYLGLKHWKGVRINLVSINKFHYSVESFHTDGDKIYVGRGPVGVIEEMARY